MPTVSENLAIWTKHDWANHGDEWSRAWAGTPGAWFGMLLPRIHNWVPCGTILEIAPGFGRWTQFLKDLTSHLIAVDLAEECILGCKSRFADAENIDFIVNDGQSLDMVKDRSVDFIFSFDSLVHAEADVMKAYLAEIERVLSADGVAFVHHSNVADLPAGANVLNKLSALHWRLEHLSPNSGMRGTDVSGQVAKSGLATLDYSVEVRSL